MTHSRTRSTMEGWVKVGPRRYRHTATKVEVRGDLLRGLWQIIGGANDSYCYTRLWVAMADATGTKAEFVKCEKL